MLAREFLFIRRFQAIMIIMSARRFLYSKVSGEADHFVSPKVPVERIHEFSLQATPKPLLEHGLIIANPNPIKDH
jgi:hypothetical protein